MADVVRHPLARRGEILPLILDIGRRYRWILLILAAALVARFWELSSYPPSVFYDEIYPYTVVLDQLRGQGVYYTPVTSVGEILARAVFGQYGAVVIGGPTTWAIRAPGAFYGVLLVLGTFLLARTLFDERVGLWAALLVALEPIAIEGSRVLYMSEIQDAVALTVVATWLFVSALRSAGPARLRLYGSYVLFGLTTGYFFSSYARLTSAIVLVLLVLYGLWSFRHRWPRRDLQNLLLYPLAAEVLFLLLIPLLSASSATTQLNGNAALYFGPANLLLTGRSSDLATFLGRYVQYYSPGFLMIAGDPNPSQNTGLTGEMLYPAAVFFYVGLLLLAVTLLRGSARRFPRLLMLFWMASAPVVAAAFVYNDYTDSSGAQFLLPALEIIAALGIVRTLEALDRTALRFSPPLSRRVPELRRLFRYRASRVATVVLVGAIVVSSGVFMDAYFVRAPPGILNDPSSQWGEMFGFPQVAEYLSAHGGADRPVFISPDGLFGNNRTLFDLYFRSLGTPQNYLDYYSDGTILNVSEVNVSTFYSPVPAYVVTGSASDLSELRADGVSANATFAAYRPDGALAMEVVSTTPGLNASRLGYLRAHELFGASHVLGPTNLSAPALTGLRSTFSMTAVFTLPPGRFAPSGQYHLVDNSNPTFSLGYWAASYFEADGSSSVQYPEGSVYTNASTQLPGSWNRLWSPQPLAPGGKYSLTLEAENGSLSFYVNQTLEAGGSVAYPLYAPGSRMILDASNSAFLWSVTVWDVALNPVDVAYLYYTQSSR
ncbi:MAG TPA: glycosyltransferase family 39 protein [Thermoplasmata archaeon]|nr:glycosyltransferase family 39 protein [Thermoplasmata archaeon]